jgi:light-regulated signal transduction histidine kinase (bacteriophytochrome)
VRFVFANLIGNACKFTHPNAEPSVEVGGSREGDEVVYFVRDHGIGFDMRFADKLFKVFERLHVAQDYPGHGVGLAIVARLVRRHGGRVWAQGAVEKGATFYFALPVESEGDGRPTA